MILNIIPEDKFIPFLQGVFDEALPNAYAFRIISSDPGKHQTQSGDAVETVGRSYLFSKRFLDDASRSDGVIFHNLTVLHAMALLRLPASQPVIWRGWGCDYYELMRQAGADYLLPATKALRSRQTFISRLWQKLSSAEERLPFLANRLVGRFIFKKAIPRVNYFSSCVPEEIDAVKSLLPSLTARYVQLNYYSHEDIFLKGQCSGVSGGNILLGNSSTATNNHLDAISHLATVCPVGSSVITPLSYGDPDYRDLVIESAKKTLGDAFAPLCDYMPLEQYNELTSSCSNVVMNHLRQQGIGNISAALMRGAKVYLQQENPIYRFYRSLGVHIFRFPDECTGENLSTSLSAQHAAENRAIMASHWARKVALGNVRTLNKIVL